MGVGAGETPSDDLILPDDIKTEEVYAKEVIDENDESITVDLDAIDLDFEEGAVDETVDLEVDSYEEPDLGAVGLDSAPDDVSPGASEVISSEDDEELTLDLDSLDIDLEEDGAVHEGEMVDDDLAIDIAPLEEVGGQTGEIDLGEDEELTLDLDSLDIDLEEDGAVHEGEKVDDQLIVDDSPAGELVDEIVPDDDEELTLDLDSLDIDLDEEETLLEGEKVDDQLIVDEGPAGERPAGKIDSGEDDEELTLDLDSLDIDLDEDEVVLEGEKIEEEPEIGGEPLEEVGLTNEIDPGEDEELTLDLDSLDIDLDEDGAVLEGEKVEEEPGFDAIPLEEGTSPVSMDLDEDEELTLDLDSLDISLSDDGELKNGEIQEEDEKLTLEDAGLTFDELSSEEMPITTEDSDDEKLTLEDAGLTFDELSSEEAPITAEDSDDEKLTLEDAGLTFDELSSEEAPITTENSDDEKLTLEDAGLTFDELSSEEMPITTEDSDDEKLTLEDAGLTFDELTTEEASIISEEFHDTEPEDIHITIDEIDPNLNVHNIEDELSEAETILTDKIDGSTGIEDGHDSAGIGVIAAGPDDDIDLDEEDDYSRSNEEDFEELPDIVPQGAISFSIDYSLKYSRLGAFTRLVGLYFLGLFPHYMVLFLYIALTIVLGIINNIIVIATGKRVEDFSLIQENTVRYFLSLCSSLVGVVEEMPIFAGRSNVDYPMQLEIKYSMRYSKLLAVMRLSVIGIILLLLPHIIILSILSIIMLFLYLIGLVITLIAGRWPYFLFDFFNRYFRYLSKIMSYLTGLVDKYPSFKFV